MSVGPIVGPHKWTTCLTQLTSRLGTPARAEYKGAPAARCTLAPVHDSLYAWGSRRMCDAASFFPDEIWPKSGSGGEKWTAIKGIQSTGLPTNLGRGYWDRRTSAGWWGCAGDQLRHEWKENCRAINTLLAAWPTPWSGTALRWHPQHLVSALATSRSFYFFFLLLSHPTTVCRIFFIPVSNLKPRSEK